VAEVPRNTYRRKREEGSKEASKQDGKENKAAQHMKNKSKLC